MALMAVASPFLQLAGSGGKWRTDGHPFRESARKPPPSRRDEAIEKYNAFFLSPSLEVVHAEPVEKVACKGPRFRQ